MMIHWQPIETAPKEHAKDILLFGGVSDPTGRKYSRDANVGWWDQVAQEWYTRDMHSEIVPTHWMPLPEPPK